MIAQFTRESMYCTGASRANVNRAGQLHHRVAGFRTAACAFNGVRVHIDMRATELARAVRALTPMRPCEVKV
jgi:hypothetical protein